MAAHLGSRLGVPDLHGFVLRSADDELPVWREIDRGNARRVTSHYWALWVVLEVRVSVLLGANAAARACVAHRENLMGGGGQKCRISIQTPHPTPGSVGVTRRVPLSTPATHHHSRTLSRQSLQATLAEISPSTYNRNHQQPEVNYFDVLEKGDFPCILNSESLVFRGKRPFRNGVNSSLLVAGGRLLTLAPVSTFQIVTRGTAPEPVTMRFPSAEIATEGVL